MAVWVVPLNLGLQVGVPLPFQASPMDTARAARARGVHKAGRKELPCEAYRLEASHPITHPAGVRAAASLSFADRTVEKTLPLRGAHREIETLFLDLALELMVFVGDVERRENGDLQ